jgi:hypothetical protein
MLLPFTNSLIVTHGFDPEMSMLADRHYSRRTVGARQFLYSGRKLVIRNSEGTILFGWVWPYEEMRMDGQTGFNCAIFRNESDRLSSEVILECEAIAAARWGTNRMYTYVDPRKIRSSNPGYCFKRAGWKFIRLSADGKHLLAKETPCPAR